MLTIRKQHPYSRGVLEAMLRVVLHWISSNEAIRASALRESRGVEIAQDVLSAAADKACVVLIQPCGYSKLATQRVRYWMQSVRCPALHTVSRHAVVWMEVGHATRAVLNAVL
jgi:hypothetical protein